MSSFRSICVLSLLLLVGLLTLHSTSAHDALPFQGNRSIRLGHNHEAGTLQDKIEDRTLDPLNLMLVNLTAFPTTIDDNEDVVISYSGIPNPTANDFISVSCGPLNPHFGLADYLDAINVPDATGTGSVRFLRLIMMRCNYVFNYISNITNTYTALATTTVTMRESFNTPKQGHVALTGVAGEMLVMYVSGSQVNAPLVRYGTSPGQYTTLVEGKSSTYNATNMCGEPASVFQQHLFRSPGYIHTILLESLDPATTYYYQYGNDVDGWSDERSFLSYTPNASSVKFLAWADMGTDIAPAGVSTVDRALEEIENGYNNFLLHFGDISYARGSAWQWDLFGGMIEPISSRIPYLISPGNHEYDHISGGENDPSGAPGTGWHPIWGNLGDDSSGECGVPIYNRYATPANGNSLFWYSFDYGPVHIVQMSTEHNWTRGSEQYDWIQNDLQSVDRTVTPWVILTGHRMMYTTQLEEDGDYIVSEFMKKEMDDLVYENKVNMMLVGHQHSYERSCPVYKKQCQPDGKGTIHIIIGTAGAGLETGGFSDKFGNWSLVQLENWGYLRIEADATQLHAEFVLNQSGEVYDEVTIYPWLDDDVEDKKKDEPLVTIA